MSESTRYAALNDSIFNARGEDIQIDIAGPEPLSLQTASIAPESACTSMQLHLQVSPDDFAANWNAAQVLAGPQLALGANSPYFFGHQLWSETRIELFAQSTDTRPDELKTQGVRPRVWFGERWITSIFDLFEENVRYFPSLLPELSDEDPVAELAAGRTPHLAELRLHNGTVYRWNRPVYDVVDGQAASAGGEPGAARRTRPSSTCWPTRPSTTACCARCPKRTARSGRRWVSLRRNTISSRPPSMGWTAQAVLAGFGHGHARRVGARQLLPMADEGLGRWGVATEVRDRFLGVIEGRAKTGRNGASWQVALCGHCRTRHDRPARAGRDAAAVLRTHAQQRARPHLG